MPERAVREIGAKVPESAGDEDAAQYYPLQAAQQPCGLRERWAVVSGMNGRTALGSLCGTAPAEPVSGAASTRVGRTSRGHPRVGQKPKLKLPQTLVTAGLTCPQPSHAFHGKHYLRHRLLGVPDTDRGRYGTLPRNRHDRVQFDAVTRSPPLTVVEIVEPDTAYPDYRPDKR
jgi:hypothetical protein